MDQLLDRKTMMYIGAAIVVIVLAFLWWRSSSSKNNKDSSVDSKTSSDQKNNKPIIYGSMGCPYTVKQVEKYPDHEFVDCTGGKCPSFVTAYPTTKWPDGRVEVGFS
jgi:hypothetical protein